MIFLVKVCFDYGHGGRDPGAVYNGRKESVGNLDMGSKVAEVVGEFDIEIGETRKTDIGLSLRKRVDFANKGNYDYFISFHRNAFIPEVANGVETFIYPKASPKAKALAEEIQRALVLCGFRDRGVKTADFYVLRATKMPAILIELGFIDNTSDNELFDQKRVELVEIISRAIIVNNQARTLVGSL